MDSHHQYEVGPQRFAFRWKRQTSFRARERSNVSIVYDGYHMPLSPFVSRVIRCSVILGQDFLSRYVNEANFNHMILQLRLPSPGKWLSFVFYEKYKRELDQRHRPPTSEDDPEGNSHGRYHRRESTSSSSNAKW